MKKYSDYLGNAIDRAMQIFKPKPKEPCPEFPHFGATYPDARCIDGFLWDLDSSDGSGDEMVLTRGGDDPCPFCNLENYLEWAGANDPESGVTKEQVLKAIERWRK